MSDDAKTWGGLSESPHIVPIRESIGEGSIVTLKQGGPSMVVLARSAREALVAWHNDTGDLFEKMLPLIALKVKT